MRASRYYLSISPPPRPPKKPPWKRPLGAYDPVATRWVGKKPGVYIEPEPIEKPAPPKPQPKIEKPVTEAEVRLILHNVAKPAPNIKVGHVGYFDLGDCMCKWPYGDPRKGLDEMTFCGRSTERGKPYCDKHKQEARNPNQGRYAGGDYAKPLALKKE